MPDRAARLRFQSRKFARADAPTAARYSAEFRVEVVQHTRERVRDGVSVSRIARDLGLRPKTLGLWLRQTPASRFRAVRVEPDARPRPVGDVPAAPTAAPVVVIAGGVRIEGLDLDGVVRLVRSLA